jgi:hypothetical protein
MQLPRETFIRHFGPTFQVHCLKFWFEDSKVPPEILPGCLFEGIKASNGRLELDRLAFRMIVWPTIKELHRKGKGACPTPEDFTGALYDALSAAGVGVTIGPALGGHG